MAERLQSMSNRRLVGSHTLPSARSTTSRTLAPNIINAANISIPAPDIICGVPSQTDATRGPSVLEGNATLSTVFDARHWFARFGCTQTSTVPRVARPRGPKPRLVPVTIKVSEPVRDALERIAESQGASRSALIARILERYVDEHPAGESS